jgi:phenylpyruvate tautomerase PptA (4-oxalocrotonate tautomerase family)
MPSIDIQVMEGVFSTEDKRLMIEKVTTHQPTAPTHDRRHDYA